MLAVRPPLLKRLEAAGLITRLRGRDDERSVQIALTRPEKRYAPGPTLCRTA
jgi:DNA-binding MarR family transcriptional regulator